MSQDHSLSPVNQYAKRSGNRLPFGLGILLRWSGRFRTKIRSGQKKIVGLWIEPNGAGAKFGFKRLYLGELVRRILVKNVDLAVARGDKQQCGRRLVDTTVHTSADGQRLDDLAVIRIRDGGVLPAPIAVGTSADLKVGQFAYAIGNPFGLDQSLTMGVISALKRRLPTSGGREIADAIQTDAAINPGNSGGPLLDSSGRLIGVNTAIFSPSGSNAGIGFAIPVDVVNRIVPELIRNGGVKTPGIGIVSTPEAITTRLGIDGVAVVRTAPDSPAQRAGLQGVDSRTGALGDIIVAADGKPVHHLSDLTDQLEQVGVGHKIRLTVRRNGQDRTVDVDVVDIGHKTS